MKPKYYIYEHIEGFFTGKRLAVRAIHAMDADAYVKHTYGKAKRIGVRNAPDCADAIENTSAADAYYRAIADNYSYQK